MTTDKDTTALDARSSGTTPRRMPRFAAAMPWVPTAKETNETQIFELRTESATKEEIEQEIKALFARWARLRGAETAQLAKVRYAGPILGAEEYTAMLDAIFGDWWSGGKFTIHAENKLAQVSKRNYALLANSGSSANLILMSAAREKFFKDGDKILTLSCGFPTTVNPIIQNRLIPVFVDIDLDTLALDPEMLDRALSADPGIKGVFVAHTLGFKTRIHELIDVVRRHNVHIFFDCCDAYGTTYAGEPIQAYGKAVSFSFYPAHHVTMGEGGAVATNDDDLHILMRGMRNWGRYCSAEKCCIRSENPASFCPKAKFTRESCLPEDYSVNYQYEWLGYNLKPLDLQAAILTKQLERLPEFDAARRRNYLAYQRFFASAPFELRTWALEDGVSPFAFPIMLGDSCPFNRKHLTDFLTRNGIETRLLFAGNLMRHPAYTNRPEYWESIGSHTNADRIAERVVMLGVSPVNTDQHIAYVTEKVGEFFKLWQQSR